MSRNKENLEGIVSKLKKQGIDAGEEEKQRLVNDAKEQAEQIISEANAKSKSILEEAKNNAVQIEKNAQTAIAQASRDMIEATKVSLLNYLKSVFGKECKTLFTQEQYLKVLLKVVLGSISGNKSVEIAPEMLKDMEAFIKSEAFRDEVVLKPLSSSNAEVRVMRKDKDSLSFVLSSKDVEAGLFALLNKNLVDRITKVQEE